ncbi:MAG: DNA-directed RNA polymerase subunit beta' [Actinobacteria bacterium]|nr:DNA-directed RNA polymerase subunit beta' [Actinomycetota bacterium]
MLETIYDRINDYGSVRISLASPNDIRSWSFGEVKKPETINYRTYRPEKDGLFCERIFGPERDWECACGKFKGTKHKGIICDRCGVKVTHSRVRRKRMGHINLAAPIVHIWFFKATPSRLGSLLGMKNSDLEKVIYFQDYVVTDPGDTPLTVRQVLSEDDHRAALSKYGENFKAGMGAESIKELLVGLDLAKLSDELRQALDKTGSKQRISELTKRLAIVEALKASQNQPEWTVMECVPVIPPDLRPLVLLESGNFATSDLNDLYRRIINRNNRLKKLLDLNAPEVIIRNEKRMLQQAVDSLFDNGRCRRPVVGSSNRPLKSLTDMIKGKQGRFRENLLGKRVDYSARSVIVVGPELKLYQCGLPKRIALELYQPFIIRLLKERGLADTIKSAKKMLERKDEEVWDILEEVITQHLVLLNRAPTLHRMGIQAFQPVLIEGNAIEVHPLVCKGFNADFDGDQMAVHLPLSIEAQIEAHLLMLSVYNIFSPSNGDPIVSPSQDIILGIHFLTYDHPSDLGKGQFFTSVNEAITAYELGKVSLHAKIFLRMSPDRQVVEQDKVLSGQTRICTTVGRCIFNDILPQGMPFYNYPLGQGGVSRVISDCHQTLGRACTIELLDSAKDIGFRWSTRAGLSIAITDLRVPTQKPEIIDAAQKKVDRIESGFRRGVLTDGERHNQILDVWVHAREEVTVAMMEQLKNDIRDGVPYLNPIWLMTGSGARGSVDQIRQLAGMRGLMSKPSGEIIETPIRTNFREGLSVLDYFSSTHGARKGLADTALKTADSGYLTRKLADVAQNVVVNEHDCGTMNGLAKSALYKGDELEVPLSRVIIGRIARDTIVNPVTDKVIVAEGDIINEPIAREIEQLGLDSIRVRSSLTCESRVGICAKCYGVDLSTGRLVEQGLAAGIIAAQAIGEPGTQLTMRTFHTGGVASREIVTSEVRTTHSGKVKFGELNPMPAEDLEGNKVSVVLKHNGELAILDDKDRELESYSIPYGAYLLVKDGHQVKAGTRLATWDPHRVSILAEAGGVVRFEDIEEGETVRIEAERKGTLGHMVIIEHKGEKHPRIIIEDQEGTIQSFHYLPAKAHVEVEEGQQVNSGHLLARQPRDISGTQDITGGLPRVTEIFEARKPKDPSVLAEISGQVEIRSDKRRGKMTIIIRSASGMEKEHHVPHNKHLQVHTGDFVEAGVPLTDGPLVPHDILRIKGEDALQQYLLIEVQNVYRSQNVKINDKHAEIILAQMLRKVQIESVGDSKFLPGAVVDKFHFRDENTRLAKSLKILEPGDSDLHAGDIVSAQDLEPTVTALTEAGRQPPKTRKAKPATASALLLGITKASLRSESFVSAASFQETTRVLTEAALASREDRLQGLKENVIMGHLIPAGTAFKPYLDMKVKHLAEPVPEPPVEAEVSEPVTGEQTLAEADVV